MNLDLPLFEPSGDELDDILADLDRALDADFLGELESVLERTSGGGKAGDPAAPAIAG